MVLAEVLAVVGGDDDDRVVQHSGSIEKLHDASEPRVHEAHTAPIEATHPAERARGDLRLPQAIAVHGLDRQVSRRLPRRSQAPDGTQPVVRPWTQIAGAALHQGDEPEARAGATVPCPVAEKLVRGGRSIVGGGAKGLERPAQVAPRAAARLPPGNALDGDESLEAGREAVDFVDPGVRADGRRRVSSASK